MESYGVMPGYGQMFIHSDEWTDDVFEALGLLRAMLTEDNRHRLAMRDMALTDFAVLWARTFKMFYDIESIGAGPEEQLADFLVLLGGHIAPFALARTFLIAWTVFVAPLETPLHLIFVR